MAFLRDNDYKQNCDQEQIDVLTNLDPDKRSTAEKSAISVFKGKLQPRYDVDAIFTEWDGEDEDPRNAALVMHLCNYAQYVMSGSLPPSFVSEDLVERSKEAIYWLKDIQSGKDNPGFPLANEGTASVIRTGNTAAKSNNIW